MAYLCSMEKCETIKAPQLDDFSALDGKMLNQLKKSSTSIFVAKGKTLFKENQLLNQLYCIKTGACKFTRVDSTGREHILRFLGEGELLGKRSIISNSGAKVSAKTLTDCTFCAIDKTVILKCLNENRLFCKQLLFALTEDLNQSEHERILFGTGKGIKQRLASLLLYLNDSFGKNDEGELTIQLKREDMAAVLGTSQEYIINLLREFKDLGVIGMNKRKIKIISKKGMKRKFVKNL